MRQIEVTILGQSYVLGAPDDGEDTLLAAVKQVDREMTAIRNAGKVKARERIAVLAALNLAYVLAQRDGAAGPAVAPSGSAEQALPLSAESISAAPDVVDGWIRRIDLALSDEGRLI